MQIAPFSARLLLATLAVIALAHPPAANAGPASPDSAVDVSSQVKASHTGFTINRATHLWTATMTIQNTGTTAIAGPIQVLLTNLSAGVSMSNSTGTHNGSPYITASADGLAPGASVSVPIQFTNPSGVSIAFTPVTASGTY